MKKIDVKDAKHGEWYFVCGSDGVLKYLKCHHFVHKDVHGNSGPTTYEFRRPDGMLDTIDVAVDYIFEV